MSLSPREKCCFGFGLCSFLVGFLLVAGGPFLWIYSIRSSIENTVNNIILKNTIITAPANNTEYTQWKTNFFKDAPPYYSIAYFYNLTNPDEVLNNQSVVPIYKEVGPYYYYKNRTRFNIEFYDNGTQVQFNEFRQYEFIPSLSNGKESDIIYNYNPAFFGVLAIAGGDAQITYGITGPILERLFNPFMFNEFITRAEFEYLPETLSEAKSKLEVNSTEQEFFQTWANATADPSPVWEGMRVSDTTSSGISLTSTTLLWNPSQQYSLLDTSSVARDTWYNLSIGVNSAAQTIMDTFKLTKDQVTTLMDWIGSQSLSKNWSQKYLVQRFSAYGVSDVEDIAFLQWGEGVVFQNQSVYTRFPRAEFLGVFEYGIFAQTSGFCDDPSIINATLARSLLTGPVGVFDMTNIGALLLMGSPLGGENFTEIQKIWGLDLNQATCFIIYASYNMSNTYGIPTLQNIIFPQGGGMITKRTVNQWLYNAVDPLLQYAKPSRTNVAFLRNDTDYNSAAKNFPANLVYTGKNAYELAQVCIVFQGKSKIVGAYPVNVTVSGFSDWGQFEPFTDSDPSQAITFFNFVEYFLRPVPIVYHPGNKVKVQGLHLLRFVIPPYVYGIDPMYNQYIDGFANVSGVQMGAPVFICNPHFAQVPGNWSVRIKGIRAPNENDTTTVDIEPNTGKVVNVRQALQINIYVEDNPYWFGVLFPNAARGFMAPIAWVSEESTINSKLASQVKDIYLAHSLMDHGQWIFVAVGCLALIIAAICFIFIWLSSSRHRSYEKI